MPTEVLPRRSELRQLVSEVVAPAAAQVDQEGRFPKESIDALAAAGFLAITVPEHLGGGGQGPGAAVEVVRELAQACGSTSMVVTMHFAATAALVAADRTEPLQEIAAGRHLTTLAFSEVGSRSHFWAPEGTATPSGDDIVLNACKSWVTSAASADSYIWSSRPIEDEGPMTLWYVPTSTPGLDVASGFDGLGLRGNGSTAVTGAAVTVPRTALIGEDGGGLDFALASVLPWFLLLNAAASAGLMQAVTAESIAHAQRTVLAYLGQTLAEQLPTRTKLATMQFTTDRTLALLGAAVAAVEEGAANAPLFALQAKAVADEAVADVADLAMDACGGAAFRKEVGIERRFRDSRAARVMAPTHDALVDMIGRVICGQPLLGPTS